MVEISYQNSDPVDTNRKSMAAINRKRYQSVPRKRRQASRGIGKPLQSPQKHSGAQQETIPEPPGDHSTSAPQSPNRKTITLLNKNTHTTISQQQFHNNNFTPPPNRERNRTKKINHTRITKYKNVAHQEGKKRTK